jgi:hypothetical protein
MRIKQISVTVSKEIQHDKCSWGVKYGTTADLSRKDEPIDSIIKLDQELRDLIAERLKNIK